jgi:hypothetical protein
MAQLKIRAGEVPELIRKTAEEITGEFYELNRSDQFRASAGSQRYFIRRHWKSHVNHAVQALSMVLGQNGVPAENKEQICEAILEFNRRSSLRTPGLTLGRLM